MRAVRTSGSTWAIGKDRAALPSLRYTAKGVLKTLCWKETGLEVVGGHWALGHIILFEAGLPDPRLRAWPLRTPAFQWASEPRGCPWVLISRAPVS